MDYNSLIAPKGTAGSIANWVNYSDTILPRLNNGVVIFWNYCCLNKQSHATQITNVSRLNGIHNRLMERPLRCSIYRHL